MKALEKALFNMVGGSNKYPNTMTIFFLSLFSLLIKSFLVMITYNYVVPRLLVSFGKTSTPFRELSFAESMMLLILSNTLFSA